MRSLTIALLAAVLLTGCAGLGQLLPGGGRMTDLQMEGFTGAPELVMAPVGDTEKLIGCTVPLHVQGEAEPRQMLLEGDLKRFCDLLENTGVTINATADADGTLRPRTINPEGVGDGR